MSENEIVQAEPVATATEKPLLKILHRRFLPKEKKDRALIHRDSAGINFATFSEEKWRLSVLLGKYFMLELDFFRGMSDLPFSIFSVQKGNFALYLKKGSKLTSQIRDRMKDAKLLRLYIPYEHYKELLVYLGMEAEKIGLSDDQVIKGLDTAESHAQEDSAESATDTAKYEYTEAEIIDCLLNILCDIHGLINPEEEEKEKQKELAEIERKKAEKQNQEPAPAVEIPKEPAPIVGAEVPKPQEPARNTKYDISFGPEKGARPETADEIEQFRQQSVQSIEEWKTKKDRPARVVLLDQNLHLSARSLLMTDFTGSTHKAMQQLDDPKKVVAFAKSVTGNIVGFLYQGKEAFKNLVEHFSKEYTLSQHATQTAIFVCMLGMRFKMSGEALSQLVTAAFLANYGKSKLPAEFLENEDSLEGENLQKYKHYPEVSATVILKGDPNLKEIAKMVLQHRERLDGSGFPKGLSGKAIPQGSQIIGIADRFQFFTTGTSKREALSGFDALRVMKQKEHQQYSDFAFRQLVNILKDDE